MTNPTPRTRYVVTIGSARVVMRASALTLVSC